jgi:cell division inhibitor SepF
MGRRVLVYLGLVDDDEYEEYEPQYDDPSLRAPRAAPQAASAYDAEPSGVRTLPRTAADDNAGVTLQPRPAVVRPITPMQSAKVHVVAPGGFNDAQEIGDKLKANQPVIVNLQSSDADLRRRLIDFASGLTYGLGGQMERVAKEVFLLTPSNVEISAEEKRRLQERGLMRS